MNELKPEDVMRAIECCLQADGASDCYKLGCPARMENGMCFYETDCEFGSEEECLKKMLADALALICRQKAQIEDLQARVEVAEENSELNRYACSTYEAEIERYKKVCGELALNADGEVVAFIDGKETTYIEKSVAEVLRRIAAKTARTDAINEFAERIKVHLDYVARWSMHGVEGEYFIIGKPFIDQIAKELKGETE